MISDRRVAVGKPATLPAVVKTPVEVPPLPILPEQPEQTMFPAPVVPPSLTWDDPSVDWLDSYVESNFWG